MARGKFNSCHRGHAVEIYHQPVNVWQYSLFTLSVVRVYARHQERSLSEWLAGDGFDKCIGTRPVLTQKLMDVQQL